MSTNSRRASFSPLLLLLLFTIYYAVESILAVTEEFGSTSNVLIDG